MSNIYATTHGTVIGKSGGLIVVKNKDGSMTKLPSQSVETLNILANVQVTHDAIMEVLHNNGRIFYFDKDGNLVGTLGNDKGNSRILVRQLKCYINEEKRLLLAKYFVQNKIAEQRKLLVDRNRRFKNIDVIKDISKLETLRSKIDVCEDVEEVMGIEGAASSLYFSNFGFLLGKSEFEWNGRIKRPAIDPVNSMLSFGYYLLEKDVLRAVNLAGLTGTIGYLHSLDYRKESLVYDIMEKFRPSVDRFVLKCIGLKRFHLQDFGSKSGKCYLNSESIKRFIAYYEEYVGFYDEELPTSIRMEIVNEAKSLVKRLRELTKEIEA